MDVEVSDEMRPTDREHMITDMAADICRYVYKEQTGKECDCKEITCSSFVYRGLAEHLLNEYADDIASQVEAATIERCAKVAEEEKTLMIEKAKEARETGKEDDKEFSYRCLSRSQSAAHIAAAIRSLSEGEKG